MKTVTINLLIICFVVGIYISFISAENMKNLWGEKLAKLGGVCIDTSYQVDWWSYQWCFAKFVKQVHIVSPTESIENLLGKYQEIESGLTHQIYRNAVADCLTPKGEMLNRYVEVELKCCGHNEISKYQRLRGIQANTAIFISSVEEKVTCSYYMTVCVEAMCDNSQTNPDSKVPKAVTEKKQRVDSSKFPTATLSDRGPSVSTPTLSKPPALYAMEANLHQGMTREHQEILKNRVKDMFYHGYRAYMDHGLPQVTFKGTLLNYCSFALDDAMDC